jgi:hypothetical protein
MRRTVCYALVNSSYPTYYSNGGIFIPPGQQTYLKVEREFEISLLPKPYGSCEVDSISPSLELNSDLFKL